MSSTDETVQAQKLAFSLFLKRLKDELKTRSPPQEKNISCFISYAWEGESRKNKELQAELGELASALRQLKVVVMFDINNMEGDITSYMKDNINSCDKVLFIGTPRFKERVLCINGKPTNLGFEYQTAMKKDKSAIVPLWYRGDSLHGAFPEELHNTLILDFRNFSCFVKGMTSLTHKGLIPSLFNILPDDRQYGTLVADLEKNFETILSGNVKSIVNDLIKEHQRYDSTHVHSPANAKLAVPVAADHKVTSVLTRNVEMQEGSSLNMDNSSVTGISLDENLFHEKTAKFPLSEDDKMLIDKFKNLVEKYLPRDDSGWRDWIGTRLSSLSENTPTGARKEARIFLNESIAQLEKHFE